MPQGITLWPLKEREEPSAAEVEEEFAEQPKETEQLLTTQETPATWSAATT